MKTLITLTTMLLFCGILFSQTGVNRNWQITTAHPDSIAWSASKIDQYGSVVTVGNAKNSNGDADIYIEKVDQQGNLEWSMNYDHAGGNDYGIALVLDNSGNILVTGAVWNATNQNYDFVVTKVNSSGSVIWMNTYNSPFNLHDIPAAIVLMDQPERVIVCGGSEGSGTLTDYLTICLNTSNGNMEWAKRYDYANLHDGAVGVRINQGNHILVAGASADSSGLFDNALVQYDYLGNAMGTSRTTQGIGIDQPRALEKDADGNWYVTGFFTGQPLNSSIVVFKLDTALDIVWNQNLDPSTGHDQGNDLIVDDQGNTYITGFVSEGVNQLAYTAKISSSGGLEWERTYKLPNHSAKGLKLTFDADGWIEVLGEISDGTTTDLLLIRYSPNGQMHFARKVHLEGDVRATDVLVDYSNQVYITGQVLGGSVDEFITLQYAWSENEMDAVVVDDKPLYVNDELLIRFNPSMMKMNAVDNRNREYGTLNQFVEQDVINAMNEFVDFDFGRQTVYKVFRSISSKDSISISRQGHEVRQPKLWSTLNVQVPTGTDFNALQPNLESLFPMIYYTDLNLFGELNSVPNDVHYPLLSNLHSTTSYPNADINIEPAWEIETGRPEIKVGVFDSGLEHDHEDFQFQGNSVVQDVWDFKSNTSWITNLHADSGSHGTQVAGIIGAVRNNNLGVAGVAGGHDSSNSAFAQQGVSLYGLRVTKSGVFFPPVLSYYADAIYTSTLNQGADYAYGLDLQNHSVGFSTNDTMYTDTNITLLRDGVRAAYRNGVALFCARGNDKGNYIHLPATLDDKWVMNVTGTGEDGLYMNGSPSCEEDCGRGRNVDVAAPGDACTIAKATVANIISNSVYFPFAGTSGSTPQVAGVAALLCSYLNDTAAATFFALAPEDMEWIIQLSATDIDSIGPDTRTGYGRLNAGAALQLVEKPDKKVEHHGTVSTSGAVSVSFETTTNFNLSEIYETDSGQVFQNGMYQMDRYKITAVVNHAIDTADSIIAYWTRNDNVTTLPLPHNGELTPHEECFVTAMSETQATLEGYVYHVKTLTGTHIGWIPRDTTTAAAKLEYTLLIHPKSLYVDSTGDTTGDTTTFIIETTSMGNGVLIYPNPATNSQHLEINLARQAVVSHNLRSANGSLIRNLELGLLTEGHHTFNIELNDLPQGIYFHEIQIGEELIVKRLVHH